MDSPINQGAPWRLHAGWLLVRGDADWLRHWCVLTRSAIVLYADEECEDEVRQIPLRSTRAISFADQEAPSSASKHCHDRPWGFALLPSEENQESLQCFDAEQEKALQAWIQNISDVASPFGDMGPKECFIDDFSDYEDEDEEGPGEEVEGDNTENFSEKKHRKRTSLYDLEETDWSTVGTSAAASVEGTSSTAPPAKEKTSTKARAKKQEVQACDIDDFSDYEDDSQMRRSSLVDNLDADWTLPDALAKLSAKAGYAAAAEEQPAAPGAQPMSDPPSELDDDPDESW